MMPKELVAKYEKAMKDKNWNWWDDKGRNAYELMNRRHRLLWAWVKNFIKENKIKSIFEVGGGLTSEAKGLVPIYQAVDINRQTDAIHEDFTKMDVSPWKNKFDLFLGCGVVEHCDGYAEFFKRVIALKPKHAIISFFWGVNRSNDRRLESGTKSGKHFFWYNKYSRAGIEEELKRLEVFDKSQFVTLGKRDIILLMNL